jgi:hypothetical protein
MKQIFDAHTIIEAHIVAGLLEQHGIQCHISGQFLQGAIGELPAGDFAQLSVEDEDEDAAKKIIADYEAGLFNITDAD